MTHFGRHAVVCSHVSSAFAQPTFYSVPPKSQQPQAQSSTHASQKLLNKLTNKSKSSNTSSPHSAALGQSLEEHAVHASITSLPHLGDALLRVTHSAYVLELTLLDWLDGAPASWEFKEQIVPMPLITIPNGSSNSQRIQRGHLSRIAPDNGQLAYIYVLLHGGTLYRLSFPLISPFFHDDSWNARRTWCKEFTIPSTVSRPIGGTGKGTVILQGEKVLWVTVNSGAVMRLEVDTENDGVLKEKLFYPQHHSLLAKVFRSTNPEEDGIISIAAAPKALGTGGDVDFAFTVSRDRSLRIWDKTSGNIATTPLPSSPGSAPQTAGNLPSRAASVLRGSSMPPPNSTLNPGPAAPVQPLPAERRTLLRVFYTASSNDLRVLVFMPTPPGVRANPEGASGGFFILYKLAGSGLVKLGEKEASERTGRCALRDFVVKASETGDYEVHCLWERSGETMYEFAELGIEPSTSAVNGARQRRRISNYSDVQMRDSDSSSTSDSDADSESDELSLTPTWHLIPSLSSQSSPTTTGTPQADHVDFLSTVDFASPGVTSTILNALFRPAAGGGFSPYTIAEALRGYVEAAWVPAQSPSESKADEEQDKNDPKKKKPAAPVAPLKDPNSALRISLLRQYPTLRARVGAVVGCRLKDLDLRPGRTVPSGEDMANIFGATMLSGDDVMSGGEHQREYYATLRRDWEGFLARCREIEKAGRWPVALGLIGCKKLSQFGDGDRERTDRDSGECVVMERERMGMLIGEDQPLAIHRRVLAEIELEQEDDEGEGLPLNEGRFTGISRRRSKHNAPRQLIRLALSLKSLFAASSWAEITHELYTTVRNGVSMLYQDLLLDLARRVALEDVDTDTVAWVFDQIGAAFEDDETQFQEAIDAVSRVIRSTGEAQQIEAVKVEDDEEEVGRMLLHSTASASQLLHTMNGLEATGDNHNQWTKSLTASYLSATLEARYEIASSIIFLLMLLKSRGHEWVEQTSAQHLDELFAGLRSNSILRQTASRVMEGERESPSGDDPNASFMDLDGISRANPLALVPSRTRAGTVDSVAGRMAGMRVGANERPHVHFATVPGSGGTGAGAESGPPPLPATTRGFGAVPLLQSLLLPLKRAFKLPYASDAFLFSNGIIENDTLAVASVPEVKFAEELRRRGNYNGAADVIDWLPKGNACCYVAGRLRIQRGDYDEAADLFERSARSFGYLSFRSKMEELGLIAVLPKALARLDSLPDYYQHVAELFENKFEYRYAVPFYKLAIESAGDDISTRDLWYNVFRGQLATGDYEQAYISIGLMNDSSLRSKSVPELVTAMCEGNMVELLMSFNFVEYFKLVQEALGFKARNADPLERPLYSHILHRWHIQRGNYRAASIVMYQRARSLGEWERYDADVRFMLLEQQLESYASAISALGLLDAGDAWISLPIEDEDDRKPFEWGDMNASAPPVDEEDEDKFPNLKIIELSDMRREFELCKARRDLALEIFGVRGYIQTDDLSISPMEVLLRYSEYGLFEEALYSARVFQMDMTVIFSTFVERCITMSTMGPSAVPEEAKSWTRSETVAAWEGGYIQKAWRLLQECLDRHDSASIGWQYRKICLERIMDADRSSAPPTWLTTFFQDREPEYLIRTCLRYHLTNAALDYTMFMIQKANQPFDKGAIVAVTQTHLPYALIDSVVAAANTKEERRKASVIKAEIKARIGRVGRWEWN